MNQTIINKLVVAYPSGNTTAIVFDDLKQMDREELNASILKTWQTNFLDQPPIEQCCFVSKVVNPKALGRVEMFGGEFCGNATRSAIWLLSDGKNGRGLIETSGCSKPLKYSIKNGDVTLEMPIPTVTQTDNGLVVEFDGITQVVVSVSSTRATLEKILANGYLNLNQRSALGVSSYDEKTKEALFSVWVKDISTIFDETACGSGTAAIGIAQAIKLNRDQSLQVIQPSGELIKVKVETDNVGDIKKTAISGAIDILYSGEMELV